MLGWVSSICSHPDLSSHLSKLTNIGGQTVAQRPNHMCLFTKLTHFNQQLKTKLKTSFSRRRKGNEFMFAFIPSPSKFFSFINYSHHKCSHIKCREKNKIICFEYQQTY